MRKRATNRRSHHPDGRAKPNGWLESRLLELRDKGKNKKGLAEELKLQPARITEIISGVRQIGSRELKPMARYLELPVSEILAQISGGTLREITLEGVLVKGAVQAGIWREALEWDQAEWYPAPIAPDRRFAGVRQFGLEVVGPSMNEVYPDGSIIVCAKVHDLGRDPKPGERVVVCRRREDEMFEATVKELRQDHTGAYWLWPRSTDPNFQQPWKLPKPDEHDGNDDIRIVAIVIGSYRPEG